MLIGYTWAMFHHMLGGVRHLIWDTGAGLEKHTASKLGWATLAGSVLLTVVVCLGVVTAGRRRPHGVRATVVMGTHRWLSLGMLAFLAAHIVTAIARVEQRLLSLLSIAPLLATADRRPASA